MNHVDVIQFSTDDGESIFVFIKEATHNIDDDGEVTLQIPIFADERSGVVYLSSKEIASLSRSPVIRRATQWALNTRMSSHHPRLPKT
jgi:hypothetical protein